MNVLIAGCGFVGNCLGQLLHAAGHSVWGLRRNPHQIAAPLTPLGADLNVHDTLRRVVPEGITHVCYAVSAGEPSEAAYRRAYVDGSSNLLRVFEERHSAPRWVFISSTAVYAQTGGEWVDETSPTEPTHFSGKLLLEGEQQVLTRSTNASVLRCAGIYGPGRDRLLRLVRSGQAHYDPQRPRYTNRIHRDDVARCVAHLFELERPAPLYIGVDHDPAPEVEVYRWLAARLGVPEPTPESSAPTGRRASNKRCNGALLRQTGYRFHYPSFREGYLAQVNAALSVG